MGTITGALVASINNGPPVRVSTFSQDTDQIEVTSFGATKPDLRWEYVDRAGHFHAYDSEAKLPTLYPHTEQRPCPGGCDDPGCEGYTVTIYECVICAEQVEPGRVPDREPKFVPGRTHWQVEVEGQVTGDRVSVRLTTDGPLDPFEAFGVAAPGPVRAEGGPDGVRVWTTLHGTGPLGNRKRRTPAAV